MPALLLALSLPAHILINVYLFFRMCIAGEAISYLRAMRDGIAGLPGLSKDRRQRQKTRDVKTATLASALTWSPLKIMKREADIRTTDSI